MVDSENRVAVVTGGERGIGRGIVSRLLADGWRVLAAGVDEIAGARLVEEVEGAEFRVCDVASEQAVRELFAKVDRDFGRLDGLALNAGIAAPERKPIESVSFEGWESVLAVNLTGPFLCAKHASALLRRTRGSMVAIASTRALMSEPNTFAYSASKGGLVALAHSLAISLGPEIRVNAVSPGWIETGDYSELRHADHAQHPCGRVGLPTDVAALVAFLLDAQSGFVTGQNFVVDGGMTKKMIYEE